MASVKLKSLNGPRPKKDRKKKLRLWKTPIMKTAKDEKEATQTTLRKTEGIPIKTQSVAHHLPRSNGKRLKKSKDREKCSNHWKD